MDNWATSELFNKVDPGLLLIMSFVHRLIWLYHQFHFYIHCRFICSVEYTAADARSRFEPPAIFPTGPRLRHLCHTVPAFLATNNRLDPHWADAYDTAWDAVQAFQSRYPRSDCYNILYLCHSQLKLSYSTIKIYLAGTQHSGP